QAHDHGQIAVPAGHGDLVDGEGAEMLELGLGVPPHQVALLDVLDHVPAEIQVMGDVADGHAAGQLQGVGLEGPGVAATGSAKGTSTWRTAPQARHSTRGMRRMTAVGRSPMGTLRKRRSTWPREMTSWEPQAEQRQSSGSWAMVKIT